MSAIILANQSSAPDDAGSGKAQIYAGDHGKLFQQAGSGAPVQAFLNKYSTGFATSHGGVTVAAGSTHTITHNLSTTDVTVSVWSGSDADGSSEVMLVEAVQDSGGASWGAYITDVDINSVVVQLSYDGRPMTSVGAGASGAFYHNDWAQSGVTEYIKVVVIG